VNEAHHASCAVENCFDVVDLVLKDGLPSKIAGCRDLIDKRIALLGAPLLYRFKEFAGYDVGHENT
jgi:hypothetical protein